VARGARASGQWSCLTFSTRSATPPLPMGWNGTKWSRTWSARTSTARRRTPAAAAGPGTLVPPPGCTGLAWKRYSVSVCGVPRLELDPCIPPGWTGYEITYRHRSATYHVVVENSGGSGRGVRSVTVDGRAVPEGVVELADDGGQHKVRIELGP
jgi:hypothetical protein